MPLVACQCTNCGAALEVDNAMEAAVCKFCGTPFIVEKAINIYKTVNVTTNTTDWKRLASNGMQLALRDNFNPRDLRDIYKVLKDVSEEEFYVRFFEYMLEMDYSDKAIAWLGANVPAGREDELAKYFFNKILKDYNKENISDVHFNIHKNYKEILPAFILNDKTLQSILFLTYMGDKLSGEYKEWFDMLKNEAYDEISNYTYSSRDEVYALGLFIHAFRDFLGPDYCDSAKATVNSLAKNLSVNNLKEDYGKINHLKEMGYEVSTSYKVTNDLVMFDDAFEAFGKKYPLSDLLAISDYDGNIYLVVKTSDKSATVLKITGVKDTSFTMFLTECDKISFNETEKLAKYTDSYKGYKMEALEGLSYKPSIKDSIFKFIGKFIK